MGVKICSETCSSSSSSSSPNWSMSPRISFSDDLSQTENIPIDPSLLDSPTLDFDFCITDPNEQGASSADELFFNGKILPLPIQIQPKTTPVFILPNAEIPQPKSNPSHCHPPPLPPPQNFKRESLREIMEISQEEEKSNSKSFWHFTRSNSLNCTKKSLICSLSPLLSRSNSTGSTNPNPRRPQLKDGFKSAQKPPLNSNTKISWPSSSSSSSSSIQKPPPPLKKNNSSGRNLYGSHSNGGVRIIPVLNVPPPYISKGTTTLFSYFFTGKDTKNKKKCSSVPHPSYSQRI